jgi:hypothetical protein
MGFAMGIIPIGFKEAEEALKRIHNGYPAAVSEAINRSLEAGRTAAAKAITARYTIKSSVIKASGLEMKKATYSNLNGTLNITGRPLPVTDFSPDVRVLGGRQQVSVAIIRGQKKLVKSAFQISGGRIMERKFVGAKKGAKRPGRLPILPVMTIGVSEMAAQKQIHELVQSRMQEALATRLKHNVEYELGKLARESEMARQKAGQKFLEKLA